MRRIAMLMAVAGIACGANLLAAEPDSSKPGSSKPGSGQSLEVQVQPIGPLQFQHRSGRRPENGARSKSHASLWPNLPKSPSGVLVLSEGEASGGHIGSGWKSNNRPDALRKKLAGTVKLPEGAGLAIEEVVPDSPAAKAGLQKGDVLLYAGGKPLKERAELSAAIQAAKEGSLNVGLMRDGKTMKLAVRPARRELLSPMSR